MTILRSGPNLSALPQLPTESLLRAIVDSCDDAIISKDLNGIITSWNPSAERLFGYTAEEAIGKPVLILIPGDRLDEEISILARLRRGERVDHFQTIRRRKDGSLLNISLTISPVKDADGRVVGASKVARDITETLRHQEALEAANRALQQANADLQQFADSASHDLQEPLRMVASYAQLLQMKFGAQLGPKGAEYIARAVEGTERMDALLRDLRVYTQVSTSNQVPKSLVDAGEVLRKVLADLEDSVSEASASIRATELPKLRIFEFQLQQLLQNLISNAIRYRQAGEPPVIVISASRESDHWLFSVEDNGMGIAPEYKEQIFGIFKRLRGSGDGGTGMGLAICQRVVGRVGGRIWVESVEGGGSTFFFTIPF